MSDNSRSERFVTPLLTLGDVAGGFGLASCCAIPLYLTMLGLGTAWLGGIGLFASLHHNWFLAVAVIGLLSSAILITCQRKSIGTGMIDALLVSWLLGATFLTLGVLYV